MAIEDPVLKVISKFPLSTRNDIRRFDLEERSGKFIMQIMMKIRFMNYVMDFLNS